MNESKTPTPTTQAKPTEHVHGPGCNHDHNPHHSHQQPIVRGSAKIGRNDPCSCGSGDKYKKCCGRLA
jgi:uncharacterized protein YecA (UPF0149 family)